MCSGMLKDADHDAVLPVDVQGGRLGALGHRACEDDGSGVADCALSDVTFISELRPMTYAPETGAINRLHFSGDRRMDRRFAALVKPPPYRRVGHKRR